MVKSQYIVILIIFQYKVFKDTDKDWRKFQ